MNTVTIYALCEPDTEEARYIGQTLDLKNRLATHLSPSPTQIGGRFDWIRGLAAGGYAPMVRVLEEVASDQALEREAHWIAHYRAQGADLFNAQPGRVPGKHKEFPYSTAVRFSDEGEAQLRALAAEWGCSEAEAVRRAVDQVAASIKKED